MLGEPGGHDGASSRPDEAAAATCHGGTCPMSGHRERTAQAAPITADTASANGETAGSGGTGSTPTSTNSPVNQHRTASARPANTRSQPRTVSTGNPSRAAITRAPAPAAFAASAAPITSTTSARLTSANTGRRTCETLHATHRDRRGRTTTGPAADRSDRVRAHPQRHNTPAQPGHRNAPLPSPASTTAVSAPTVSTAPPRATRPSRAHSAKRLREGLRVPAHRQGAAPNEHPTRADPLPRT